MKKVFVLAMCMMFLFAVLVLFSASAFADIVVGTPGDGWQTWSTSSILGSNYGSGVPFWNGTSADYPSNVPGNIGNYLTNTGAFVGGSGPGNLPYWGTSTGGADTNFYFVPSGYSVGTTLKIQIASWASQDIFGWFNITTGTSSILFDDAAPGTTATFTPTGNYAFFFITPDGTWQTYGNGTGANFALFNGGGGTYWLGMEDESLASSDKDYNDMIVEISPVSSVPVPAAIWLLGSGLLGLVGVRRRFKG